MGLVWLEVQDGRLGALRPLGLCVGHVLAGSVVLGGGAHRVYLFFHASHLE